MKRANALANALTPALSFGTLAIALGLGAHGETLAANVYASKHTPIGIAGFTTRPATRGRDCLDDLLAWNAQPPPEPLADPASPVPPTHPD